jgi:nucleotide-binding universal stress UspA family protein
MRITNNLFIVGIDFWAPSKNALEMAAKFARQYDGKLLAVHVLEKAHQYPSGLSMDEDTLEEDAERELETLVEPYRQQGLLVETEVLRGNVTYQITSTMHDHEADVLFVGIREGSFLEDIFIGTNTLHLVKAGDFPVVVVDNLPRSEALEEALIPLDRQHGLNGVLHFLKSLAVPLTQKVLMITSLAPGEDEVEVHKFANDVADKLQALGIEMVDIEIVKDEDPMGALIDQIKFDRGTYDIVLLEHHNYSAEGKMSSGSLIEEVVTKCAMPVLCAPKFR